MAAYADTRGRDRTTQLFAIEQLVAAGAVARQPLLPSLRYHPAAGELAPPDSQLPWPEPTLHGITLPSGITGEWARQLGARVPGRLVSSAKSWLSHSAVDRSAAILPWGAADGIDKISPLAASAAYLAHIRADWDQRFPDYPLAQQDVILTLPASFDEDARALTVDAAHLAGLEHLHLVEEPQAACYDWLYRHKDQLAEQLDATRLLLVVDVGGGTTDLTLIQVEPQTEGLPRLTRIAVGEHLMLGGDNMDLALAHHIERQLGQPLSTTRLAELIQQCRRAKERLLAADAPESVGVTLLGGGGRLIGGARTTELGREEVTQLAAAFLPLTARDELPQRRQAAIVEFGLPYAADPAISRHLAAFLQRHTTTLPDTVLLNGGVFHADHLRQRLLDLLTQWRGDAPRLLLNPEPDYAVARGAVAYGLARRGKGLRIGGGAARSYFLLVEDPQQQTQAVCLLPQGTEEDRERSFDRQFTLRLGQPVQFHLASVSGARRYRAGQLLTADDEPGWVKLPPMATVLDGGSGETTVQLVSRLTELGTLALNCVSVAHPERRWALEFQLRGHAAQVVDTTRLPPRFDQACELIRQYYGSRSGRVDPKGIKTLRSDLEKLLGKRDEWDTVVLRELFAVLLEGARRRRRSADHERLWCNLVGYSLRPGYGYPLDDWRVEQLWPLYAEGLHHAKDAQNWAEWWTLWRRIGGGLTGSAQAELFTDLSPYLRPPSHKVKLQGVRKLGYDDMVRLAASLEHLAVERKIELGAWWLQRLKLKSESVQTWQALGRLGGRVPLYGSAHQVVPREVAADWLDPLLHLNWHTTQPASLAAVLLARVSGDRERDLDPDLREQVAERLRAVKASPNWIEMVTRVTELAAGDEQRLYGDSLPTGLKLLG